MQEIKSLTSLRGIAALAVVMQHFSATAEKHSAVSIPSLVPHGYLAVDFFFVLSGYIMCYTYLAAFQRQGVAAYGPFLLRRAVRLLPLNIFVTLALLLLGWASVQGLGRNIFFGDVGWGDVIANLLMLQGLGVGVNMNGPAWSVSAEFLAYLAFPLLVACTFRKGSALAWVAATLALAGLLGVALSMPRLGLAAEDPLRGGLRCLTEFTLGMLAYRVSNTGHKLATWLGRDPVTAAVLLAVPVLLVLRVDFLAALIFPVVVVAAAQNHGHVDRALARPVLHWLGVISYSIYLIHNAFRPAALTALQALHPQPLGFAPALLFALAASLAVVPFAWLTYRWVELPSREWLRRHLLSPGPAASATDKTRPA
jgi:peptidoglycan/LPS O-acetylase OafA/YrhL